MQRINDFQFIVRRNMVNCAGAKKLEMTPDCLDLYHFWLILD